MADEKELDRQLAKTAGFRLMGQRFSPDAYWMGRLVFPAVGAPKATRKPAPFSLGQVNGVGPRRELILPL